MSQIAGSLGALVRRLAAQDECHAYSESNMCRAPGAEPECGVNCAGGEFRDLAALQRALGGCRVATSTVALTHIHATSNLSGLGLESLQEIRGHLALLNTSLTGLQGLAGLRTLQGTLYVLASSLPSLAGLAELTSMGGLQVADTHDLSLAGTPALTAVRGSIGLLRCQRLDTALSATLQAIDGNVTIHGNTELKLTGFAGLATLGSAASLRELNVTGNHLAHPEWLAFASLDTVYGWMRITDNANLERLAGLRNLSRVTKALEIGCANLTTLEDLSSLRRADVLHLDSRNTALATVRLPQLTSVSSLNLAFDQASADNDNQGDRLVLDRVEFPVLEEVHDLYVGVSRATTPPTRGLLAGGVDFPALTTVEGDLRLVGQSYPAPHTVPMLRSFSAPLLSLAAAELRVQHTTLGVLDLPSLKLINRFQLHNTYNLSRVTLPLWQDSIQGVEVYNNSRLSILDFPLFQRIGAGPFHIDCSAPGSAALSWLDVGTMNTVEGHVILTHTRLPNLSNFSFLTKVAGDLDIADDMLLNLDGLAAVTEIAGSLSIACPAAVICGTVKLSLQEAANTVKKFEVQATSCPRPPRRRERRRRRRVEEEEGGEEEGVEEKEVDRKEEKLKKNGAWQLRSKLMR